MMSYDDVVRIYRNEKHSPTLNNLPDDFYAEVKLLVSKVEESHRSYLGTLIDDLFERRKNKIVMHALRSEDYSVTPANILPVEKDLYDKVVGVLKAYRKTILSQQPTTEGTTEPMQTSEKINVRILKAMPSIVGSDMKDYGPFTKDHIIKLPTESANMLIQRGYAEEV